MSDFREALQDALKALDRAEVLMPSDTVKIIRAKTAINKALQKRGAWEWIKQKIRTR